MANEAEERISAFEEKAAESEARRAEVASKHDELSDTILTLQVRGTVCVAAKRLRESGGS